MSESRRVFVSTSSFGQGGPAPLKILESHGFDVALNETGRPLREEEISQLLSGVEGLIAGTEPLTRGVLEECEELAVISRCGAGSDNVDLEAASELGIKVRTTSAAHVEAVAELALAGLLCSLRRVALSDRRVRTGDWVKESGTLLHGKTVGIVGLGRVGKAFALLLRPFRGRILATDLDPDRTFAADQGIELVDFDTLRSEADVVSLHVPYSASSGQVLDRAVLESLKPGAFVVNTARGGLVDEEALADRLADGSLGGAFLDVYGDEPYHGRLGLLDNVVLTPHIGGYTAESRVAMETEAVNNLVEAIR